jgi:DNA-binding MarR family transcriptional regulator
MVTKHCRCVCQPFGYIRTRQLIKVYIINAIMKWDFTRRFGFLVKDVARLYTQQFDRLVREHIGLSHAQCRLIGALARHGEGEPLSQTELAQRLELTPMAVAGMCDRLAAAGWIRREPSATDRRVNQLHLEPRAMQALEAAMDIGDSLSTRALAHLSAAERTQLLALLAKARTGLLAETEGAPA